MCKWFRKKKVVNKVDFEKYDISNFDFDLIDLFCNKQKVVLIVDQFLCDVAYSHSKQMALNDKASHDNFSERVEQIRIENGNVEIGEVVGRFYRSPEGFFNAFQESKEHNKIISERWVSVGVASVDTERGKYLTAIFEKP